MLTLTTGMCGESMVEYDTSVYGHNCDEDTVWISWQYRDIHESSQYFCECPPKVFIHMGGYFQEGKPIVVYVVADDVYKSHTVDEILSEKLYDFTKISYDELVNDNYIISYPFKNDRYDTEVNNCGYRDGVCTDR